MATVLNKAAQAALNNARITGTQKHYSALPSVLVESVAYTPAQIEGIYQADLAGMASVSAAELAVADARAKAKPAALARQQFDRGYKRTIEGAYGNAPAILGDFGIAITIPKVPTAAEKAAASAKAKATRALRHTMGKVQKAKLTTASAAAATPPVAATPATPSAGGGTGK